MLSDFTSNSTTETGQARLKTHALQNAIFNSARFPIIATDETGIIQIFNVGAQLLLGYTANEVVNRLRPDELHDPDDLAQRARTLSAEMRVPIAPNFEVVSYKASRGMEDIYEVIYVCKDGSRVPTVVTTIALRDASDHIIGYLKCVTENTVRRGLEAQFKQAMHAAEKANQAKSEFLSRMSHELRTPLNAILGFAQLIESGTPPPTSTQKQNLDQILKGGWYLLALINEVLDLSLVESGRMVLSNEPISVPAIMQECKTMIEPQAAEHGIALSFAAQDLSAYVLADRIRIKQVMINLLMNAIKYNRSGGHVTVSSELRPDNQLRISVRDTGVGMTTEQQSQLFQPFNRLGQENGNEEGTGIGLVVTKRLVELMGGKIGVQSTLDVGSEFWIELALTTPVVLNMPANRNDARLGSDTDDEARHYTVLYVEDNPANTDLVGQIIARRSNLELLCAANGATAIEVARLKQPDVILMDINLPGMSGIEAMRILHADASTAHIPIVAVSANAMPHDIAHSIEAGFSDYVTKPIKVGVFLQTLDAAIALSTETKP